LIRDAVAGQYGDGLVLNRNLNRYECVRIVCRRQPDYFGRVRYVFARACCPFGAGATCPNCTESAKDGNGHQVLMFDLHPRRVDLGEMSPNQLVEAIRSIARPEAPKP